MLYELNQVQGCFEATNVSLMVDQLYNAHPYTLIPVGDLFRLKFDVFDKERYLMSEQNGTKVSTKPRRSRQSCNLNSTQKSILLQPTNDDKEAWKAYWKVS